MTTKQALEGLREKVWAGEYPSVDIQGDLNWTSFKWEMVTGAFEGSLDAAKALDLALPTKKVMSDETAKMILFGENGARTWLLWKLDALIEKEEK